ncbi:MAG: sodium:solute symporter family protein [Chloroflexota bacterium]
MLVAAILLIYVLCMLLLGYWGMRRTRTVGDFFLGGRSIGPWMSAFAYGTTYFSAVLFVGYAGKLGWGFGHHTLWIVAGNTVVGTLLAWWVLAKRTRRMTQEMQTMTMPEFLEARYGSRFLRIASALIIFIFLVPYSASVYTGLSYLVETIVGVPYVYTLAALALLTAVYLMMGGYFALTLTDFIQGAIMLVGAVLMVVFLVGNLGGITQVWADLEALTLPGFAPVALHSTLPPVPDFSGDGWLILASLVVVTSLGPWGMPQMVQKFYSLKNEGAAKRATIVATVFALVVSGAAYFSGGLTHLYYQALPLDPATGKGSVDYLMPNLVTDFLPTAVGVLIMLLIFAASMSTLSSLVLVSSSSVAIDLYQREVRPQPSQSQIMALMRVLCGVFIAASLAIALLRPAFILSLMVISWGAIAGAFIGPYVYGLFWSGANRAGAIGSMFCGLGTALLLYLAWGEPGVPIAGALAMIVPLATLPIISIVARLVTSPRIVEEEAA